MMPSTTPPKTMTPRPGTGGERPWSPTASKRIGYSIAVAINLGLLHVAHRILPWGWPGFVTEDWNRVLPVVSLSLVTSIIANTIFFWFDRPWFTSMMNLITTAVGLIAAIRMWQVFPFDFAGYALDWTLPVRALIALTVFGSLVGCIAASVKLLTEMFNGRTD